MATEDIYQETWIKMKFNVDNVDYVRFINLAKLNALRQQSRYMLYKKHLQ